MQFILWAGYFRTNYLTLHPSIHLIHLTSYFRPKHSILHPLVSYFRTAHLTLHPCIYFCVVHSLGELFSCWPFNSLSARPFGKFFCAVHPLGELFSYQLFNSPPFYPSDPSDELFSSQTFNSPSFGELLSYRPFNSPSVNLFLCRPFLGRVIFVLAI